MGYRGEGEGEGFTAENAESAEKRETEEREEEEEEGEDKEKEFDEEERRRYPRLDTRFALGLWIPDEAVCCVNFFLLLLSAFLCVLCGESLPSVCPPLTARA
ncbi:MAG: hypothetical protein NT031_19830 [Planctomycetota bacterium]|nr:hypothetical protein [Planctomycetota bacterium]